MTDTFTDSVIRRLVSETGIQAHQWRTNPRVLKAIQKSRAATLDEVLNLIDEQPDTSGFGNIHRVSLKQRIWQIQGACCK